MSAQAQQPWALLTPDRTQLSLREATAFNSRFLLYRNSVVVDGARSKRDVVAMHACHWLRERAARPTMRGDRPSPKRTSSEGNIPELVHAGRDAMRCLFHRRSVNTVKEALRCSYMEWVSRVGLREMKYRTSYTLSYIDGQVVPHRRGRFFSGRSSSSSLSSA